jgi:hypothetical protein
VQLGRAAAADDDRRGHHLGLRAVGGDHTAPVAARGMGVAGVEPGAQRPPVHVLAHVHRPAGRVADRELLLDPAPGTEVRDDQPGEGRRHAGAIANVPR